MLEYCARRIHALPDLNVRVLKSWVRIRHSHPDHWRKALDRLVDSKTPLLNVPADKIPRIVN